METEHRDFRSVHRDQGLDGLGDGTQLLNCRAAGAVDHPYLTVLGLGLCPHLDMHAELRQAVESRAAQSPDALTGLEANLRFGGTETMETRVFGRLSAWQNWIFIRPNAVGANGALKVYGTGAPVKFNWERV